MKAYKTNWVVISITPNDFLKNISSNTLDAPKNAFLDRFSRIKVAFYQIKDNETSYLTFPEDLSEECLKHLSPYLRATKSQVKKEDMQAYFDLENNMTPDENEKAIPFPNYKIILSSNDYPTVSEEELTAFRLANTIPLQGVDFQNEMVLNISEEMVSFKKGCYPGQEVVARVKNLAKPAKKLIIIEEEKIPEDQRGKMTSKKNGKGFLLCSYNAEF